MNLTFVLLLLILISNVVWRQNIVCASEYPSTISFQNIMENLDIPSGEVVALLQDHDGFMWLGSRNALLRFDGYEYLSVQVFDSQTKNTTSINHIVDLIEDSRQDMWVATRSGLLRYDRSKERLYRLQQKNGLPNRIYFDTVNAIAESPTGEILAGAFSGLAIIDPISLDITTLTHNPEDPASIASNEVFEVYRAPNNEIWIGTNLGISRLNWKTKTWENFVPDPTHPGSQVDNTVSDIQMDREGQLWLAVQNGVYRFNPKTGVFKRYLNDTDHPHGYWGKITRDIFMDSRGIVWIGTDNNGLNIYSYERDEFIHYVYDERKFGSLSSNAIRCIFEDRQGDIWVGVYPAGVNFHDRSTAAITTYSSHPTDGLMGVIAETVVEDSEGNLWVGSGGVTRFNRRENTLQNYKKTDAKVGIASDSVISGLVDSDNDIWFGTWGDGFFKYDREKDHFDQIPFDATLAGNGQRYSTVLNDQSVWHLYEDKHKNIWVSTHLGGLSKYNKHTGEFTNYTSVESDGTTLSNKLVWTTLEDSEGKFWVGTAHGLNLMDREKGTFKRYVSDGTTGSLTNNSVLSIYEDKKGRLWFGTDGGLHTFDRGKQIFTQVDQKREFSDKSIRSIVDDNDGNLWMGTNHGIVMYNPDTKVVQNYRRLNGKKIEGFATGAAIFTDRGEVVLGGNNGVRIIDVKRLEPNHVAPPVVLTDFRLFTNSVAVDAPDGLIKSVINQTDTIVLDYKKNMISFGFAALNFRDPDKNQYAYKLEGFDDAWREIGNQRTAAYTNIAPGTYRLSVRASNNDGVWNDTGKSIVIRQLPPPWKTWWAYSVYFCLSVALVFLLVKNQLRKQQWTQEQNRQLERVVAERTLQLQEKNEAIQAMLSNMRQGLFTIVRDGTIHPEYSKYLEEIFASQKLAGINALELLFSRAQIGPDILAQNKYAFEAIIDEESLNFDLNAHLLLSDYDATFGAQTKNLSLDWSPIVGDGDIVNKLMVSVRDVTQLKQMEAEARNKKRELDLISQLIGVSSEQYLAFSESTTQFLAQCRESIEVTQQYDAGIVALVFRNLHTIKGNARTYGLTYLGEVVHAAETEFASLKYSTERWQQEKLLSELSSVESIFAEYESLYFDVLGRGINSPTADKNTPWAPRQTVTALQNAVAQLKAQFPQVATTNVLTLIETLINSADSVPFEQILTPVIQSLDALSAVLTKPCPRVVINASNVRIYNSAKPVLADVFMHLLRNALDHGIEPVQQRRALNKPEAGCIEITAQIQGQTLLLSVKDDGGGLNLDRLYASAVVNGYLAKDSAVFNRDVAQLIFTSGLSTKEQASDISGRGVGMDAIREFLRDSHGEVELKLLDIDPDICSIGQGAMAHFELLISLPLSMYYLAS